jgi:HEPN domain-containing protein
MESQRDDQVEMVRALAECAESLGPDVHIQTDYGDETGGRTPWELFKQEDAQQALELARQATELARSLVIVDSECHTEDEDTA